MFKATAPEERNERSEELEVAAEVEAEWVSLVQFWKDQQAQGATMAEPVIQLLEAAFERPELRQLYPYTSLNSVCFSRCSQYRFTTDCPFVVGGGNGHFKVFRHWVTEQWGEQLIGSGDLATAIELLVENLPEGTGPAVRGPASQFVSPEGWVL